MQITSLTLLPLVSFMQSNQVLFTFNVKVPQQYIYDIQQSWDSNSNIMVRLFKFIIQ